MCPITYKLCSEVAHNTMRLSHLEFISRRRFFGSQPLPSSKPGGWLWWLTGWLAGWLWWLAGYLVPPKKLVALRLNDSLQTKISDIEYNQKNLCLSKVCSIWDYASLYSSSRVVRMSGCQWQSRTSPGFDPSILRHSGIWRAADEAVLNNVHKKMITKSPL